MANEAGVIWHLALQIDELSDRWVLQSDAALTGDAVGQIAGALIVLRQR